MSVYSQAGQLLTVLDNAGDIGYDLKHNDLWTGSFTMPAGDPKNDHCQAHNLVRLPDGTRQTGLFRIISAPSSEETALGGVKTYNVEHVMATLLDDVLFGYHEVGGTDFSTRQVMQYILDRQTVKRWQLGAVEFTDYFQYHFENVSLLSALLSLGEVLTEEYTWDFDTSATPWTVNLRKADASTGCGIYYGRNLVSIEKTMDASALVTRLYPLGYGEGVNQLTIKDVNGGVPYIDADTAATWGVKCSVWTDTRIEDAATLKARARQVLEGYKNPYITYTAKAVDLYRLTGFSWDNFMPGKLVTVQDAEHGITFQARIVEICKKDVNGDPGGIEITIANAPRDAADSINTLADRVGIGELYSQGATNLFAQTFADNADSAHPAKMRVYVPSGLKRINKMLLSWQTAPFRAYETGAAAGGSTSQTSGGGGSSTETTSVSDTVTYTSETGGGCTVTSKTLIISDGVHGRGNITGPALTAGGNEMTKTSIMTSQDGSVLSKETSEAGGHSHTMESHSHSMDHTHSIAAHSHAVQPHSHLMTHYHRLDSHSHTVNEHSHGLGNHTHGIDAHSHSVNSHSHYMQHYHSIHEHSHTVNSHSHGLNGHTHTVKWGHQHNAGNENYTGGVHNYADLNPLSGEASGNTNQSSPSTNSVSLSTNAARDGNGASVDYTGGAAPSTDSVALTTGAASGVTALSSPETSGVSQTTKAPQDASGNAITSTGSTITETYGEALVTLGPSAGNTGEASPGTDAQGGHTHTVPDHVHAMGHYHYIAHLAIPPLEVDLPDHGHNVKIPGHSHSVSIPSHTHTVTVPDHSHGIVYGIFEGTTARDVTILVDGSAVPASEAAKREIDVSAWLAKDENGKILRNSWHEIQIVPDQLTRIEATLFAQVFIQSVGGGDY